MITRKGFFLLLAAGLLAHPNLPAADGRELTLKPGDRILVMAPHPDDEVLACGGVIQRARTMGLPVKVLFLTYGDSNQWSFAVYRKHFVLGTKNVEAMGMVRHDEAVSADKFLGLSPDQLVFLGYPDFRTMKIWTSAWGNNPPGKGMFTKADSVPYTDAFRPGAPYKGEEILKDITSVLLDFKPTKIFISHPADENPDHRAFYLFTRVALWTLKEKIQPEVYPYLIHYRFRRWPKPKGYHPELPLEPPTFFSDQIPWSSFPLREPEIGEKYAALQQHKTQFKYSSGYLSRFVRQNELFGDFPSVVLPARDGEVVLNPPDAVSPEELPEELTDDEKARFVGFEKRRVTLENGRLVVTINYSRPLVGETAVSVDVFGYRSDTPFGEMPKLHIKLGALQHSVQDRGRSLPSSSLEVRRTPRQVILRLPLDLLGNPEKVLTSARSYLLDMPLDWVSWRVIELPADKP
jgi:LmbE family N-acetylglucosaminyl deacetylase